MSSRAGMWIALVAALGGPGCFYHSWSGDETARIDAIVGRGWEPLEDSTRDGIPLPADALVASAGTLGPLKESSGSSGKRVAQSRPSGARSTTRGQKTSRSKGSAAKSTSFRFSGL